ncbi:MAG TPA: sugar phosphate isomerase/epimerase [Acidimicrobiales bacterium]|nr:sugar phosphate isomerase/epimerase [Acidimicrobiales bacterium]
MTTKCLALWSVRNHLAADLEGTIAKVAALGFEGVEPLCHAGKSVPLPPPIGPMIDAAPVVDPHHLRRVLDDHGLVVTSAHTFLPEGAYADAVLDEQEVLGNQLLVLTAPFFVPGFDLEAITTSDGVKRLADRINAAVEVTAARGMRIGYHNHTWEMETTIEGRTAYDLLFSMLDPAVFAEVDLYWATLGGADPTAVIESLDARTLLLHLKDGPAEPGLPQTPLGTGTVDLRSALRAATHAVAHIVELDDAEGDAFDVVAAGLRYLRDEGTVEV